MKKIFISSVLFLTPLIASAQNFRNLTELINFFTDLIYKSVVPLLVALAVVYFIWGLITFIKNADSEPEREKGRSRMIWGVIALFVIVAVWGLVGVLANTFGVRVGIPGPPGTNNNVFSSPSNSTSIEECLRTGVCL